MENARAIILKATREKDFAGTKRWTFLHRLHDGVAKGAELDSDQVVIFTGLVHEVASGEHADVVNHPTRSWEFIMRIATWVNGAHVANRAP